MTDSRSSQMATLLVLATLTLSGLLAAPAKASARPSSFLDEPHLRVELVVREDAFMPGGSTEVSVIFQPEEHWHVYWENPGDSGVPPQVDWKLPDGVTVGELRWPAPDAIRVGPLVNYGYEGEAWLTADLAASPELDQLAAAQIEVDVVWLVCRAEECIPGRGSLGLELPVLGAEGSAVPKPTSRAEGFAAVRRTAPVPTVAAVQNDGDDHVLLSFPSLARSGAPLFGSPQTLQPKVSFFPHQSGWIAAAAEQEPLLVGDHVPALRLARDNLAPPQMSGLSGVLVSEAAAGREAFAITTVPANASSLTNARPSPPTVPTSAEQGLSFIILFAFLGGALLNLMPCVFPVLSLKVMSFVTQGGEDPAKVRAHGWAFTAGVVVSFWVLAATLIGLRAAGEQIGWGFQLQEPAFIAFLAGLLTLLALSLVGVFDVGLSLTTVGGSRAHREGLGGSFWTGALATVVATPCTAPFMGPALGFALTQSALVSMLVFTALAAGMATPYLALAHLPGLTRSLPRPGPWMETLKQFMAFPLLATVLWLLSVFEHQTGHGAVWWLASGLLFLALAAWMFGRLAGSGLRLWLSKLLIALVALAGISLAITAARIPPEPTSATASAESFWQPWSPERVATLREEGEAVFVNFTAAWCISCQVNERTIFATDAVQDLFTRFGVHALKADWTNPDADIAAALAAQGRDGVPLYLYYAPGSDQPPVVLPQIPTLRRLEQALRGNRPL